MYIYYAFPLQVIIRTWQMEGTILGVTVTLSVVGNVAMWQVVVLLGSRIVG